MKSIYEIKITCFLEVSLEGLGFCVYTLFVAMFIVHALLIFMYIYLVVFCNILCIIPSDSQVCCGKQV